MHIFDQTVASLQSAICLYILLNWQREKVLGNFINQINNNTLGAGLAKHYSLIRNTRLVMFTTVSVWTFGWIAYFGLFYAWNHSCWPGVAFNLFVDPNLNLAAFLIVVYSEICCIVAKTFMALTYVIILVEFLSLNIDLVNDVNLNQLAVQRHYFGIHGKLRQTLQYLNQSYQPFNTATLVLDASLIQLNTLVLLSQPVELFDAIFAATTTSFAFIEILFLASLSTCLKAKVRFIFDRIHYLSATSLHWEHEVKKSTFYLQSMNLFQAGIAVGLSSTLTVNTLIKGLVGFSMITGFLITFRV
ncbi:unnamed protein product [Soboliphyme baturini]|uniref:Gustatory receptor n=1 Tax=Soboliphyme baturini TaxID=241478 RepID=A0A183IN52_9BILA|nr:unnamed protein product [Soboliphyme baturini]